MSEDIDVSFNDYDTYCSDCTSHDSCHRNGSIDYDKIAKCKKEYLKLYAGKNEA